MMLEWTKSKSSKIGEKSSDLGNILKVCWHIRCGVLQECQQRSLQAIEFLLTRLKGWRKGG